MIRKIKAIIGLLKCKDYILITEKNNGRICIDYTTTSLEARRKSLFLYNFLTETDNAISEVNKIINE